MRPVRLVVWSDYLCPWCHLASARVGRLRADFGARLEIEYRAYLLRPRPRGPGDPDARHERFVAYTESWQRAAGEADAPVFRTWASAEGPPTHSVPAHLAAKAARRLGEDAFAAMHARLLRAYFEESRDISARATQLALWKELGLAAPGFDAVDDPALLRETLGEHDAALEAGATGVPAAMLAGQDAVLVGALPYESYRRWIERNLDV
ncbi:MAG TPA: DsbA family protein [Myxococcota bacterium]|nr:DsbA family protein [Myxococcota bacterium]